MNAVRSSSTLSSITNFTRSSLATPRLSALTLVKSSSNASTTSFHRFTQLSKPAPGISRCYSACLHSSSLPNLKIPLKSPSKHREFSSTFKQSSASDEGIADLPPSSMDRSHYASGLGTTHLSHEVSLKLTILDSNGEVKLSERVFKKSDLCTEHGLEPRDLRKVDSRVPNLVPTILVRKNAFLINMLHIRALVKADEVLIFDSGQGEIDSHLNSAFLYNLEHNLQASTSTSLPYEFRALESIFASVFDALVEEMLSFRDSISSFLKTLQTDLDQEKLSLLLQYNRRLFGFLEKVRGVKNAAVEILDEDEDMAAMYLTSTLKGQPRAISDHQELELLLESFDKQVEEVLSETQRIAKHVQTTQEAVELILDSHRNQLLALDLKTSITTMGIAVGTFWVGLFGQNLLSGLEESQPPYLFWGSGVFAIVLSMIFASRSLRRLSILRQAGLGNREVRRTSWIGSWKEGKELRQNSHRSEEGIGGLDDRLHQPEEAERQGQK